MNQDKTIYDNIDEELYVENSGNEQSTETLIQRLKEFSWYLVENIEMNLIFCLYFLEERAFRKDNSTAATAVALLAQVIPKIGNGVSSAIKHGELYIFKKIDEKNSPKLADLVYFFSDNKDKVRQILIESATDIFYCFENQFMKLNCRGGPTRAMQKLAKDAAYRIFNYLLEIKQNKNLTREEITKGIVYGNSKKNNIGIRSGRTVKDNEQKWLTSDIFTKCGLFCIQRLKFYRKENTDTEIYGYRRMFDWEYSSAEFQKLLEVEKNVVEPKYIMEKNNYARFYNNIRIYIMRKEPEENAKLDREIKHEESMKDRGKKQEEIMNKIKQIHEEQLNYLKKNYLKINELRNQLINVKTEQFNDNQGTNKWVNVETFKEYVEDVTDKIRENDFASKIQENIKSVNIQPFKGFVEDLADKIRENDLATNIPENIKSIDIEPVKDFFGDLSNKMTDNDLGSKVQEGFDQVIDKIKLW